MDTTMNRRHFLGVAGLASAAFAGGGLLYGLQPPEGKLHVDAEQRYS